MKSIVYGPRGWEKGLQPSAAGTTIIRHLGRPAYCVRHGGVPRPDFSSHAKRPQLQILTNQVAGTEDEMRVKPEIFYDHASRFPFAAPFSKSLPSQLGPLLFFLKTLHHVAIALASGITSGSLLNLSLPTSVPPPSR